MADDRDTILGAVGQRIAAQRERAGLTQDAVAAAIGCGARTIGAYEHGRRELGVVDLVRIARALGIPASALVDGVVDTVPSIPRKKSVRRP